MLMSNPWTRGEELQSDGILLTMIFGTTHRPIILDAMAMAEFNDQVDWTGITASKKNRMQMILY